MDHSCGSRWSGHWISHLRIQCHARHGCQARKALSDQRHVRGASNSIHNHDRCTVHITHLVEPMHRRCHCRDRYHGGSHRCQLEAVHRAIRIVGAHPFAHRCMHCGCVFSRYPTSTLTAIQLKNHYAWIQNVILHVVFVPTYLYRLAASPSPFSNTARLPKEINMGFVVLL